MNSRPLFSIEVYVSEGQVNRGTGPGAVWEGRKGPPVEKRRTGSATRGLRLQRASWT